MRTTSRLLRVTLVAAGLMAISATAAQAMPTGPANDATDSAATAAANGTIVLHRTGITLGTQLPTQPETKAVSVMAPAVDSPTDQTVPLVISQPAPVVTTVSADRGFGWTDAGIGAAASALLLIVAGFAATRVRPRQTAAL